LRLEARLKSRGAGRGLVAFRLDKKSHVLREAMRQQATEIAARRKAAAAPLANDRSGGSRQRAKGAVVTVGPDLRMDAAAPDLMPTFSHFIDLAERRSG
jgi:hypothetical protein